MLQTTVSLPHPPMVERPGLFCTQDIPEAVEAVMKKRKPAFKSMKTQAGSRKADTKL